jgi:homopolymeric O-antigen transport system permease protein
MESARTLEALPDRAEHEVAPPAATATAAAPAPVAITEAPHGMWWSVRYAWDERDLLKPMMARFLAKRIRGTKLGRLWLLIRPFMDALGKTLLFGSVLKLSSGGGTPYFLFLLAGLIGWRLFERTLMYGMRAIRLYRKLMRSFHFPLLFVGVSSLAYPLVEAAVYMLVFFGTIIFFWATTGHFYLSPPPRLLLFFPGFALLLFLTIGPTLWLAIANARARDFRYGLRYILPIGLFVTPILYPIDKLPHQWHWLAVVNPLTAPIEMIKYGLIGAGYIELRAVVVSVVVGTVVTVSGLWYYTRDAARSLQFAGVGGGGDEDDDDDDGF